MSEAAQQLKQEGNTFFLQSDFENALSKYTNALELDPAFKEANLNASMCCHRLNQHDKALKFVVAAIKIDHRYVKAYRHLSKLLRDANKLSLEQRNDLFRILIDELTAHGLSDVLFNSTRFWFLVVDLIVTRDHQVKILEFGDGIKSGSEIKKLQLTEMVRNLLDLPTFLSSECGNPDSNNEDLDATISRWRMANTRSNIDSLCKYRGVYGGYIRKPVDDDILVINDDILVPIILDEKAYMHELFVRSELQQFRPVAKIYPLKYNASLAETISRDIPGDIVVAKTSDGTRGQGVLMIPKEKLDATLRFLLEQDPSKLKIHFQHYISLFGIPEDFSIWTSWNETSAKVFLVEERLHSMPVSYEGEDYNATMRVVFSYLESPHDEPLFIPLTTYWKIPPQSSSSGNMRDSLVSSFNLSIRRLEVDETNENLVLSALQQMLPTLFPKALNMSQDLNQFSDENNNCVLKRDAIRLQMLRANTCALSGLYCQAMYHIYDYIYKQPDDIQGKYELALTHLYCEDFDEAIRIFKETLSELSLSAMRIAMCYRKKGDLQEAKKWIDQVSKAMANDPKVVAERHCIYRLR
jgi:tetratricopeptide (TPR) repeat protein